MKIEKIEYIKETIKMVQHKKENKIKNFRKGVQSMSENRTFGFQTTPKTEQICVRYEPCSDFGRSVLRRLVRFKILLS